MKSALRFTAFLTAIILLSCHKDQDSPQDKISQKYQAILQAHSWVFDSALTRSNGIVTKDTAHAGIIKTFQKSTYEIAYFASQPFDTKNYRFVYPNLYYWDVTGELDKSRYYNLLAITDTSYIEEEIPEDQRGIGIVTHYYYHAQ